VGKQKAPNPTQYLLKELKVGVFRVSAFISWVPRWEARRTINVKPGNCVVEPQGEVNTCNCCGGAWGGNKTRKKTFPVVPESKGNIETKVPS